MPKILPGQTDIYALTDSRLSLGRPLDYVVGELLNAGIKIIQYREKKLTREQMIKECQLIREMTNKVGACFIVNDYPEIAKIVHADGLHIGQDDISIQKAREIVGNDIIIGISTHSPSQAIKAANEADYIGVGPIFETHTKEDVVAPVGFEYLDWVVKNIKIPFVAIGGIKTHNVEEITARGATCCALVSELVGAENIRAKVAETRKAMQIGKERYLRNR